MMSTPCTVWLTSHSNKDSRIEGEDENKDLNEAR